MRGLRSRRSSVGGEVTMIDSPAMLWKRPAAPSRASVTRIIRAQSHSTPTGQNFTRIRRAPGTCRAAWALRRDDGGDGRNRRLRNFHQSVCRRGAGAYPRIDSRRVGCGRSHRDARRVYLRRTRRAHAASWRPVRLHSRGAPSAAWFSLRLGEPARDQCRGHGCGGGDVREILPRVFGGRDTGKLRIRRGGRDPDDH